MEPIASVPQPTISNRELRALLHALGACDDARQAIGERDAATAWAACERGDWMLWLTARLGVDRRMMVRTAAACAETALRYVPGGEDRPRLAIEAARRWADEPTEKNRQAARQAAYGAYDAAYAAYRAYDAAYDAAYAAYGAYDAAYAAAYAAYDGAYDAYGADDAYEAAYGAAAYAAAAAASRQAALQQCADIVREHIPYDVVVAAAIARLAERAGA